MEQVYLEEKRLLGLSVRTNNADEKEPDTAKIGDLHLSFAQQVKVNYANGSSLYGVYYDYESDYTGDFSVLVGTEKDTVKTSAPLEGVTIPTGDYLVFSKQGDMPQAVIDAWGEIWAYFSDPSCSHQRAYTVDFEHYTSDKKVDVYIAIK